MVIPILGNLMNVANWFYFSCYTPKLKNSKEVKTHFQFQFVITDFDNPYQLHNELGHWKM